jgi:DNA-binding NarL/FixJ family response regulator
MCEEKIRVVIFEDNHHLRDSLQLLINTSEEFVCINSYPDTSDILIKLKNDNPDIVIMDIEMPGLNGIDSTRILKQKFPEIAVIIFTVFEDAEKVFKALQAGGSGYLLKSTTSAQILQALMDVYKGGSVFSPLVAKKIVNFFQLKPIADDIRTDFNLTAKERELLQHMANGKSYKMIAEAMMITIETVKTHVKNIYRKLHVNSSTEAIRKALQNKMVN